MALTQTTTTAAITKDELTIPVTASTGFAVGQQVKLGSEWIGAVIAVPSTTSIKVRGRGDQGTAGMAHPLGELVVTASAGTDWPTPAPGREVYQDEAMPDQIGLGASGAVTVPIKDTNYTITKGSVAALTLAAPTKAQDGLTLSFTSNTAFAHTLTATGLLNTGTATVNLGTFAAFAGATLTLRANQGKWNVVGNTAVTLT